MNAVHLEDNASPAFLTVSPSGRRMSPAVPISAPAIWTTAIASIYLPTSRDGGQSSVTVCDAESHSPHLNLPTSLRPLPYLRVSAT